MNQTTAWIVLFIVGLMLIDIGITGSMGKVLAVAFAPGLLSAPGSTGNGTPFQPAFPGQTIFPGGAQQPATVPNL
jgi:hypothetical protein